MVQASQHVTVTLLESRSGLSPHGSRSVSSLRGSKSGSGLLESRFSLSAHGSRPGSSPSGFKSGSRLHGSWSGSSSRGSKSGSGLHESRSSLCGYRPGFSLHGSKSGFRPHVSRSGWNLEIRTRLVAVHSSLTDILAGFLGFSHDATPGSSVLEFLNASTGVTKVNQSEASKAMLSSSLKEQ